MDKVILVTDGSRGIGVAICCRAAKAGCSVAIVYRSIRMNTVRLDVTLTDMTNDLQDNAGIRSSVEESIAMNRVATADEIAAPIM